MSSKTMPYRPFQSQSRVEFIKKKFESSFPDENAARSKHTTETLSTNNKKSFRDIKELNLNKKIANSKTDNVLESNDDGSKSEGKAFVKRSPAFRREKLGSAKSLGRIPRQQKSEIFPHLKQNENAKEEILKTDVNNDFKRSKTDSDLLKYNSSENSDTRISDSNENNLKTVCEKSRDDEVSKGKPQVDLSAQYSTVNKNKYNADNKEVSLLSESIRRALQSPLPKGPPPKKPPRTFCHVPQDTNQQNNCTLSVTTASGKTTSPPTRADIPKLKSKLEKLEKAIKIHESGATHINASEKHFDKKTNLSERKLNSSSLTDANSIDQSCLPISICLSQSSKIYNLKKLSRAKSEFNFDTNKSNNIGKNKENSTANLSSDDINVKNSEAIYDLPCLNKKNSFETFGKCSKYIKEAVNAKKAEDLHYMCTDVINQTPKYPNFFNNVTQRKNVEVENSCLNLSKSNFFPIEADEKSYSMNNDNKRVAKLREMYEAFNGNCDELELESSSVKSSDSSRERQKSLGEDENFSKMAAQRKIYVSRVSSKLMNQVPFWKYKNKKSYAHLFECCLVVGLTLCESKKNVPYIKSIFPADIKPPPLIEYLCFPDASNWPPNSENQQPEEQYYSLVVTNENGERKFGYCRRVLPEGGNICLPLTYCIISPHRAGGFFYQVLEELESKHGSPDVENFIRQLHESEFPGPGERLKLREILEEASKTSTGNSDSYSSSTLIKRPQDVRQEEKDLTQLFQHLELSVLLKVFSSLLHERKVLLMSNSLRNLSSCMESLQFILLPFSWQHTYIPVLPSHLIEICEAPTPYVVGLLKPKNVEKTLSNVNIEDGILVDLDDSKIIKCCGDEGSILPECFIRDLKTSLHLAIHSNNILPENVRSVLISDAFIRFFVQVCGNYSKFIVEQSNGEKIFQKENFIKSAAPSNEKQAFLDWFTETSMFHSFIHDRLQGDEDDMSIKLFSRRVMEYSEESIKGSAILLKNCKLINRKVKTLGDKIKDFTAFNK